MGKDVDVFSSISKTLFRPPALPSDDNAAPDEIITQAVPQAATVPADGEVRYGFTEPTSSLRALGLRLPGNAGDSEALILLIDLIASGLSNDNEAQKGISQDVVKRNALSEMQQNYRNLAAIKSAIEDLTMQRTELNAEKSSLQTELAVQQGRKHDLRDLIIDLSADPEVDPEQMMSAEQQYAYVAAAVESLESEISLVNGQINGIEADLARNQGLEASAIQSNANIFKIAISLEGVNSSKDHHASYKKTEKEDQQSEIFDEIDRIYELDSEDLFNEDAVVESDIERRNKELAELSAGLSSIIYAAMNVIAQEKSANQLDPYALAQAPNGGKRLQLSI